MKYKFRRNGFCPCGSGKKYKKCCLIERRTIDKENIKRQNEVKSIIAKGDKLDDHEIFEDILRWTRKVW
jgi:hypothetical protein